MQKEVNKLLKRINVEKLKNNHKECIELYNIVGGLFSEVGSYDEAIHYHEQALQTSKTIGDRLATCHALRYIGESKAATGQFYQAIDYIKKYLELTQRISNKLETQRAYTTLGRVYLMQAEDIKENEGFIAMDQMKETAREAEKHFQTALTLADSLQTQVDDKEFAQMQSGLLINLGLVKEICDQHGESVIKFNRAIDLCKQAKLKEELYRCQILLAAIFRQRYNIKMAVRTSDDALQTAKSIGKKLLICDALIERGLVKIWQRDFKNAKRLFVQAYLEKSPCEEDHLKAVRLTKLAHLISTNYSQLNESTTSDTKMKICDKLGDLFVAIKFYRLAIEFYKREFAEAKVNSKPRSELARIIYSIAETYADDGQFEHAMVCYEKEIAYRNGQSTEQCQSYVKIAQMREYLRQETDKVCDAYELALDKAGKNPRMMYSVLKEYSSYLKRKCNRPTRQREVDDILANLKSYPEVLRDIESEGNEDANELEDEIANIEDIITDDEDNDEVLMLGRRRATTKGARKFKPNEVGDTPLHEACIKGDFKRVKSLIGQGHQVNPRDNAGWIPLHEACNHGHYEIVDYLIENGADVNYRGLKGMTPLHDAATNGHFEIMRLLIKNGANVISLTDSGETVLSCLRDYKKRNYTEMSNREQSEYRSMEAELLNVMDKCGFDLMEENRKKLASSRASSSRQNNALLEPPAVVRTNKRVSISDTVESSSPVNDYKEVIGVLKRKRPNNEDPSGGRPKKANLPATYEAESYNPSAPTKDWLVDDLTRNKLPPLRANLRALFSDDEDEECGDDDRGDVEVLEPTVVRNRAKQNISHDKRRDERRLDSDDEVQVIESPLRSPRLAFSPSNSLFNDSAAQFSDQAPTPTLSSNSPVAAVRVNLLDEPLRIQIEGRRLLVPVRDEYVTVSWLQNAVADRYAAVAGAKPKVTLAPASDPQCILFGSDLCRDVIRESNLVARVEGWQLESIEQVYLNECKLLDMEPLSFVRAELDKLTGRNKLDLSHVRMPEKHVRAALKALARRDFNQVNLRGSFALFETSELANWTLNEVVCSWRANLCHLDLSCVGLRNCHFETICGGGAGSSSASTAAEKECWLAKLESLNLCWNAIGYRSRQEFRRQLESLLEETSPRLKRLDLRWNCLQFMKLIEGQLDRLDADEDEQDGGGGSFQSQFSADDPEAMERRMSDIICRQLGLQTNRARRLTLLLSNQRDYTAYS